MVFPLRWSCPRQSLIRKSSTTGDLVILRSIEISRTCEAAQRSACVADRSTSPRSSPRQRVDHGVSDHEI